MNGQPTHLASLRARAHTDAHIIHFVDILFTGPSHVDYLDLGAPRLPQLLGRRIRLYDLSF